MTSLAIITSVLALIGSALIAGVFFAFSNFIMAALGRLESGHGMAAMQSINVVVLNPLFLGIFAGTAIVSLLAAGLAILVAGLVPALWSIGGALLYCLGTFVLTGIGNVPLNNKLEATSVSEDGAPALWGHYLDRWTRLNTIRTAAATAAAFAFLFGLDSISGA